MVEPTYLLAAIGAVLSLTYIYRFVNFIWIYFLRPSSVHKYLYDSPYAIVTGASDGIGKALAKELYDNGFNLILHGRNEEKTKKVVEEIRASGGGKRDVRYFLADAGDPSHDFEKMVEQFRGLNITLVVNNAGGSYRSPEK
jgi:17beta-estradiol 17-dehydrogenase / very-long-chain 3-oxoacyl-CoA reductase